MTRGKLRRVADAITPILLGGVALWLIVTALLDAARHRNLGTTPPNVATSDTASVQRASSETSPKLLTRPIESIRVGDRVLARNPDVTDDARRQTAEPDWRECSVARLELPIDHEPNGKNHESNLQTRELRLPGDPDDRPVLHIELLRPDDWFRQRLSLLAVEHAGSAHAIPSRNLPDRPLAPNEPAPPSAIPLRPLYREIAAGSASIEIQGHGVAALVIDLDLPELGAAGTAIVTELIPASTIDPGPGRIVTGTFAHPPTVQVLDVLLEGEPEPIGVTANHLFWREADATFVPIGEIAPAKPSGRSRAKRNGSSASCRVPGRPTSTTSRSIANTSTSSALKACWFTTPTSAILGRRPPGDGSSDTVTPASPRSKTAPDTASTSPPDTATEPSPFLKSKRQSPDEHQD